MSDYRQDLEKQLEAARKRVRQGREIKALKASAPTLFEIIDGEVSLVLNKMAGDTPLSYDEYLSAHGEAKMARRIRDLINSKEADELQSAEQVRTIQKTIEGLDNAPK